MMSGPERKRRTASLARAAAAMPPTRWFADQLEALDRLADRPVDERSGSF